MLTVAHGVVTITHNGDNNYSQRRAIRTDDGMNVALIVFNVSLSELDVSLLDWLYHCLPR